MRIPTSISLLTALMALFLAFQEAAAVPGLSGVRVTDVTPSSFSVVWVSDTTGQVGVDVYADSERRISLNSKVEITQIPAASDEIRSAALAKGVMKIRVSGLAPSTSYYARVFVKEQSSPFATGYSPLLTVLTAHKTMPYRSVNGAIVPVANNMASFRVYVRPADGSDSSAVGDIVVLESAGSAYPISAVVGDGAGAPIALLDLNNLYGQDGRTIDLSGDERFVITTYRKSGLPMLTQYRRAPMEDGDTKVMSPERGFFADINLDRRVDDADFALFRLQYRTVANGVTYNPDYDFNAGTEPIVDIRDFSVFSPEYGRTGIE